MIDVGGQSHCDRLSADDKFEERSDEDIWQNRPTSVEGAMISPGDAFSKEQKEVKEEPVTNRSGNIQEHALKSTPEMRKRLGLDSTVG